MDGRRRLRARKYSVAAVMIVALGAVLCQIAFGLDPRRAISQYIHDVWHTENGLPDGYVTSICQTRDGYLWLGTAAGLVRFDGVRFVVFDSSNTSVFSVDRINALAADPSGGLWIGTNDGLVRYRDASFTKLTTVDGMPANSVVAVTVDRAGAVWAGTTSGVAIVREGRISLLGTAAGLSFPDVRTICEDASGTIWVGTYGGGLNRIVDGSISVISERDGLSSNRLKTVFSASNGDLWIGADNGITILRDGTFQRVPSVSNTVEGFCEDVEGSIWVATLGGLYRFRGGVPDTFTVADGLTNNVVLAIFEDVEGNLWVGTEGGGLNRFKDGAITTWTSREGLSHDLVCPVYEDSKGVLWVGTYGGGLNRIENGRITVLTTKDGLSSNNLNSLYEDRAGTLWVGTVGGGLNRFENGRFTTYTTRDGLSHDSVHTICEDRDGALWIGTDAGLTRYADGRFRSFTTADGLPSNTIRHVFETRGGVLWIGTQDGLARRSGERFEAFTTNQGLPSNAVEALHEDADAALWIGTDRGLCRLRDGRFAGISSRNGLGSDAIYAVIEDGSNTFWISSARGIFSVPKQALDDVADGRAASLVCTVYRRADGMRSEVCSHYFQPAARRTRDGRLWFATTKGLAMLDPNRIGAGNAPPPVILEDFVVNGETVAPGSATAEFGPDRDRFEFHYTGLRFNSPERVRFRYQLEGSDPGWVDAGTRRVAYYTNLPPGTYTFRVTASLNGGPWNETAATRGFVLAPHPTQTWWAYLLYVAGGIGIVYLLVQLRLKALHRRTEDLERHIAERTVELAEKVDALTASEHRAHENEILALEASRAKSVFVSNMSHELRTPLNVILGFVQLMARNERLAADHGERLGAITRAGEHLLSLINDILSLTRIEAGRLTLNEHAFDLTAVLTGLKEMFDPRAQTANLDLEFEIDPPGPLHVTGDEGKLRQVLINLLGNALKFTREGRVVLRATWRDGQATFAVEDTGPGIGVDEIGRLFEAFVQTRSGKELSQGTGLGLAISRSYVRLMGGDITVSSTLDAGTTFVFDIPLPAASEQVAATGQRQVVGLEPGQRPFRILVADDQTDGRFLLVSLLESVGFHVREAVDGAEALRVWEMWQPDLIWMDMRMPVMDGYETTREIRGQEAASRDLAACVEGSDARPPERCVIVGLTASAFEHEKHAMTAAGCDAFVAKPYRECQIFDTMARLLGVCFVYDDDTAAAADKPSTSGVNVDQLAAIPADRLTVLRDAIGLGNVREIHRAVNEIRKLDGALAAELDQLVNHFAFDRLLDLIDRAERARG